MGPIGHQPVCFLNPDILEAHFSGEDSRGWVPNVEHQPLAFRKKYQTGEIPPLIVCHYPRGGSFGETVSLPPYPMSMWSFLSFVVENQFI